MENHEHAGHAGEVFRLKLDKLPGVGGIPWMWVIGWAVLFIPLIIIDHIFGIGLAGLWAALGIFIGLLVAAPNLFIKSVAGRWVARILVTVLALSIMAQLFGFGLIVFLIILVVIGVLVARVLMRNETKLDDKVEGAIEADGSMDALISPPPAPRAKTTADERAEAEKAAKEKAAAEAEAEEAKAAAEEPAPAEPSAEFKRGDKVVDQRTGQVYNVV